MTKILILGAYGQIARVATDLFLKETDAQLTLYLRNAKRLKHLDHGDRVRIVEGDVLDEKILREAMASQDVVYANLSGSLEQ
jgi:saccharopine dehydrogenase-like NADP-dependent oxidoreductase